MNAMSKCSHGLCHAYRLMGNRYHLVIETADANPSRGMRQLNGTHRRAHLKLGCELKEIADQSVNSPPAKEKGSRPLALPFSGRLFRPSS
jgi:hypothetical protein